MPFCQVLNYISAQKKIFKNDTEIEITQYVNGDDSSDNAP